MFVEFVPLEQNFRDPLVATKPLVTLLEEIPSSCRYTVHVSELYIVKSEVTPRHTNLGMLAQLCIFSEQKFKYFVL